MGWTDIVPTFVETGAKRILQVHALSAPSAVLIREYSRSAATMKRFVTTGTVYNGLIFHSLYSCTYTTSVLSFGFTPLFKWKNIEGAY